MTSASFNVPGSRGKSKENWRESSWNYQCQVNAVTMIPRTMVSQDETGRMAREGVGSNFTGKASAWSERDKACLCYTPGFCSHCSEKWKLLTWCLSLALLFWEFATERGAHGETSIQGQASVARWMSNIYTELTLEVWTKQTKPALFLSPGLMSVNEKSESQVGKLPSL